MKRFLSSVLARMRALSVEHDTVANAALVDSLHRVPWILIVAIPLLLLGATAAWYLAGGMTPADYRWRNATGWLDLAMVGWLLFVGLVIRADRLIQKMAQWGAAPLLLLASSFLLWSGAMSTVDQWGRSTVTVFTLGCVFVGALILIRPAHAIALYLGSYAIFFFALGATQVNPVLLQANRVNGLVAAVLGLLLAVLLWRKHTAMVLLQRELEGRNEELKQQQLQLEILAQCDALTGLFNRREFAKLANLELLRARRHHGDTSVIMADLDFFKRVNDTYGHPAGDEVIKFMADALRNGVRGTDVVARMGGEEFIILLPQTSMEAAVAVAEKLRHWVQQTPILTATQQTIQITASFGVTSVAEEQSGSLESLYAAADVALYAAKSRGRNRVEACSSTDTPPAETLPDHPGQ